MNSLWMKSWIACVSLLATVFWKEVLSCASDSKDLHICLNIYLERDFPFVEAILTSPQEGRRGRMLLEGPDLDNICSQMLSLKVCYMDLSSHCESYWHLWRFDRLIHTITEVHNLLCVFPKPGSLQAQRLKELLMNGACIEKVRRSVADCESAGFHWMTVLKQILRLQVGQEICDSLRHQRKCLVGRLRTSECAPQAMLAYNNTMNTWIGAWCGGINCKSSSLLTILAIVLGIAKLF